MRCIGYCVTTSFNIQHFFSDLHHKHLITRYRNVLYMPRTVEDKEVHLFYFSYGVVVFWGTTREDDREFLKELAPYCVGPLNHDEYEEEEFTFSYAKNYTITEDHITLPDGEFLTLLAISHAMSQSIKLSIFEQTVQKRIDQTRYIPEQLAKNGHVSIAKKAIQKQMGEIFLERSFINLHFDLLDTPEFFWEYVELEPVYTRMAKYLEISQRVEVLNKRLSIVHELFEMLGHELDHQQGSRLEWIIIILISFEIFLNIVAELIKLW